MMVREPQNDGTSVTEATLPNAGPQPPPAEATRALLEATLKRARWTIFWERLWPALARVAVVIGFFLTVSWLGLWLSLPPLGRAVGLVAFAALGLGISLFIGNKKLSKEHQVTRTGLVEEEKRRREAVGWSWRMRFIEPRTPRVRRR